MIRKALIPIAGLATRMGPLCRAIPKAMLPLPTPNGQLRPIVDWLCRDVAAAAIGTVGLVVAPRHEDILRAYFEAALESAKSLLPERIEYIRQETPAGLGDAVRCGRTFVGDEPFLVLLGDHLCAATPGDGPSSCAAQVVEAFDAHDCASMVGVRQVGEEELPRVGVLEGEKLDEAREIYRCTAIAEKPSLESARARFAASSLPPGRFWAHAGIYTFTPEIFDCLDELASAANGRDELQLTGAQETLLARRPGGCYFLPVRGDVTDTGTPGGYIAAFEQKGRRRASSDDDISSRPG